MHTVKCRIVEVVLEDGQQLVRLACPSRIIPAPGQYVVAGKNDSGSLLPAPLFYTDSTLEGFLASAADANSWDVGREIFLRGPLGHGFELPVSVRKVALIGFDTPVTRLRGMIRPSLKQGAAVVVVTDFPAEGLPDEVEVQPLSTLSEVLAWSDYVAFDIARENLPELKQKLASLNQIPVVREAQLLIRTAMPCGGLAECGICAVVGKSGWQMACSDGPVFPTAEILG